MSGGALIRGITVIGVYDFIYLASDDHKWVMSVKNVKSCKWSATFINRWMHAIQPMTLWLTSICPLRVLWSLAASSLSLSFVGVTKSCPHPKFENRRRYWPNFFFNRLVWMRRCAEWIKEIEKGVKKRCEIAKKGVKLLIWRNFQ